MSDSFSAIPCRDMVCYLFDDLIRLLILEIDRSEEMCKDVNFL